MNIQASIIEHNIEEFLLVIKKPNKIIIRKSSKKNNGISKIDEFLNILIKLTEHFEHIAIKSYVGLSEDQLNLIQLNDKLKVVNEQSKEMEKYVSDLKKEMLEPTNNFIKLDFAVYNELLFMKALIKSGEKRYQVIRHKRVNETKKEFIKRSMKSITATSKLNTSFDLYNTTDEYLSRLVENRLHRLGYEPKLKECYKMDEELFFTENNDLLNNKVKSEIKNNELKNKYLFNNEDYKKFEKHLIIYTDGAVFNDGRSGVGVVFTRNGKEILSFSNKLDNDIDANVCEAMGILKALVELFFGKTKYQLDYVEIRTDSLTCVNQIEEKKSTDPIIVEILNIIEKSNVKIVLRWNKGHDGIEFNEKANDLARNAALL